MFKDTKDRITISLTKELMQRITEFAEKTGMSKSDVINFILVQGFESYDIVNKLPADVLNRLADSIK